jgi:hypothetical protein
LIVQVPGVNSVTVVPETAQIEDVVDAKLTERLELAVALTVNVPADNGYDVVEGLKVMVWAVCVMVKDTGTGVAAA